MEAPEDDENTLKTRRMKVFASGYLGEKKNSRNFLLLGEMDLPLDYVHLLRSALVHKCRHVIKGLAIIQRDGPGKSNVIGVEVIPLPEDGWNITHQFFYVRGHRPRFFPHYGGTRDHRTACTVFFEFFTRAQM
jgi:hypothetical protein